MFKNYRQKLISFFLIVAFIFSLVALFLPSKFKSAQAQSATEISRPTNHTDSAGATTNPQLAYDLTDGTTFSTTDYSGTANPSITFHSWQATTKTYTSLVLKYRYHADEATDDTYAVAYSTNNGSSWTNLISPTSAGRPDTTISVNLSPNQDLSLLQVKIYASKTKGPDKKNLYTRDIWTEGSYEMVVGEISVGPAGIQTASLNIPSTNQYVGGAFTFIRNMETTNVTQITITETGTVNANLNISNLKLYYETTESCSFEENETLFGSTPSFDTSEKAIIFGNMPVGISQVCLYLVLDVLSGALNGETLEIEISNPSTDVIVSAGTVTPASPVAISGATILIKTTINPANWKTDKEDTPIINVNKNEDEDIRLRIQITNIGGKATDYNYQLEYALKTGESCGDDESFVIVPVGVFTRHFRMSTSFYVDDGQPTTAQLSRPDEYTFVSGRMVEDPSNSSRNITLTYENYTEIEFVFRPNNNAIDGGSYCFRVTKAGVILEDYPIYPELQIASAP